MVKEEKNKKTQTIASKAVKKTSVKRSEVKKSTAKKAKTKSRSAVNKSSTKKQTFEKSKSTKAKAVKKSTPAKKSRTKKVMTSKTVEYQPSLLLFYHDKVVPTLMKNMGYKNSLEVPRLSKISLNVGIGRARDESGSLEKAAEDMAVITGQKAVTTRARKAISNFKLRIGDPVGCRVTLRRWKMYEFLERLISIALPRARDFRGLLARSFDGRGNYSMGIEEHIIFPEIDYDRIDKIRGMDITIVTTAKTDREGYELLKSLGFPFRLDNRFEREKSENSSSQEENVSLSQEVSQIAEEV